MTGRQGKDYGAYPASTASVKCLGDGVDTVRESMLQISALLRTSSADWTCYPGES